MRRDHPRLSRRQRCGGLQQRHVRRRERPSAQIPGGALQQPLGGGIDELDPAIEIEHDNPRRRHIEDAAQEIVLLLHALPLGAETVDHPVVHTNQVVDFRLSHVAKARRVVAVVEELRAIANERERAEHAPHERHASRERRHEDQLHGEQPQPILAQEIHARRCEQCVHGDEIDGEADAERQGPTLPGRAGCDACRAEALPHMRRSQG